MSRRRTATLPIKFVTVLVVLRRSGPLLNPYAAFGMWAEDVFCAYEFNRTAYSPPLNVILISAI
ncbi:hypothetical protein J2W46_006971 [Paraburkholderia strydomiana]|nr:hypothetical protein [Paraburkholderia strydomiana]